MINDKDVKISKDESIRRAQTINLAVKAVENRGITDLDENYKEAVLRSYIIHYDLLDITQNYDIKHIEGIFNE